MLLLLLTEAIVVYYPSMFNIKASFIKKNPEIELLMLGSSHIQDDLNPEYFDIKSANLAYGSQDLDLDSALFFKYIDNLRNLKYLILELDYHTLEERNKPDYFRFPWYYKYHKIEIYKLTLFKRWFLFSSSPEFFRNYLLQIINPFEYRYKLNKFGSVKNDFPGIFVTLNFDSLKIVRSASERLKDKFSMSSLENYRHNVTTLNTIINYCIKKDIKVILVQTPAYRSYRSTFRIEKLDRRNSYTDSLKRECRSKVIVLDHESDPKFSVHDFKNDDHLNSDGAMKFSRIINDEIKQICE